MVCPLQVALIAAAGTPTPPVLVLIWSVVLVVVACCWCTPLQVAPMLVLINFATCTGGIFPSINWCKFSTCTSATCTVCMVVTIHIQSIMYPLSSEKEGEFFASVLFSCDLSLQLQVSHTSPLEWL